MTDTEQQQLNQRLADALDTVTKSERYGVMFRCALCHADFIGLVSTTTHVPPERCCFCGSRKLLEFEGVEVLVVVREKGRAEQL